MKNQLPFVFIIAFALQACNHKEEILNSKGTNQEYIAEEMASPPPNFKSKNVSQYVNPECIEVSDNQITQNPNINKQKLIKNADVSISVKDLTSAKRNLDTLIKQIGGYYEFASFDKSEGFASYNLKVRVLYSKFDFFISALQNGDGDIQTISINTKDVTEDYYDTESRLKSKSLYLEQYRRLIKKAHSIKDIIEIQGKIDEIQDELESTQGHLNYMNDQIDYSTIDLKIFKPKEYVYKPHYVESFWKRTKTSLVEGWNNIVSGIIYFVSLWPFIIILAIAFIIIKRMIKRKKLKTIK